MSNSVCITCGKSFSDILLPLRAGVKKIKMKELSDEEESKELTKLYISLGVPREPYCCWMRLKTFYNEIDNII